MKRIFIIFICIVMVMNGCMQVISSKDNNPPKAQFSINHKSANTATMFVFDGSFSSDDHDRVTDMKYLWKYFSRYGKLIDSSYGMIDSASFNDTGYYFINLTVFDADSLSDTCEDTIHVLQTLAPVISVIDTTIDFGPVEIDYDVVKRMIISNIGTDTLKISAIYCSGEQKTAFSCNFEEMINILPDSSKSISIHFIPTQFGLHNAEINIVCNDLQYPNKKIAVKGEGFSDLYNLVIENIDQDSLDFGEVELGYDSSFSIQIKNIGNEPREILVAYIVGENKNAFRCDFTSEFEIEAGKSHSLEIEFNPQDTTFQTATLVIKSDDQFSEKKEIVLTGKGYKYSPILKLVDIDNNLLNFDGVGIEKSNVFPLEIKNIGQKELDISAIYVTGDDRNYFDCEFLQEISLNPGASQKFDITFSPMQKREYNAQLKIYSNDTNFPISTLNLTGSGTQSVLEIISPSNQKIEFGNVSVGQDSTITIKIKNTGDGDLLVKDIYLMNENASAFRCDFQTEFSIQPGATSTFTLTFSPNEIMAYSADLVLRTDEVVNDKKTISVSGTGHQNFTMLVDKDSLNFGNVYINEDSMMDLIITNASDNNDLRIFDVKLTGNYIDGFSTDFASEFKISPQSSAQIHVTFAPFDAYPLFDNVLHIYSDDEMTPHKEIILTGQGVFAPEIECADSIVFGEVNLNGYGSKILTIKNVGKSAISGMNLMIDSSEFGYDVDTPVDLSPNQSIQAIIEFMPKNTSGDKQATLTISAENFGEIKTVLLKGIAVNP